MDYREKVLYLLNQHNQNMKESIATLKSDISEVKADLKKVNIMTSAMAKQMKLPEFVDLGLPSGTLWMKCNIGADKDTDYGLYFQWGDTVGYGDNDIKTQATWKNCPGNDSNEDANEEALTAWDKENLTNGILHTDVDAVYAHTKVIFNTNFMEEIWKKSEFGCVTSSGEPSRALLWHKYQVSFINFTLMSKYLIPMLYCSSRVRLWHLVQGFKSFLHP